MFTKEETEKIKKTIIDAELETSGEIRVHIGKKCMGDPYEKAIKVFNKLGMHRTELRNGVLIFLAPQQQKLAIIGDEGINNKVPDNFWDNIKDTMINHFKSNDIIQGLTDGITQSALQLKEHFPYTDNDKDELSNEITFDK